MNIRSLLGWILGALLTVSHTVNGGGFFLIEQSVSSMGTAYAGATALAEDASTIFFNPAGMSKLPCQQIVAGGHVVIPVSHFKNNGTINALGQPIVGNNGGNNGAAALVPHSYWVKQYCNWSFGVGLFSPFGLVTDYKSNWVGRYGANRSRLTTIDVNPSVAYRINDCLSIGAGFNAMWADTKLTREIDFTLIGQNPFPDGKSSLTGSSWGYGGNVGILWDVTNCTRVGASYRSKIVQNIDGRVKYKNVPPVQQLEAVFQNTGAKTTLNLPAMASLGVVHQFNCRWTGMFDISWFQWDTLEKLRIKFNNPLQDDQLIQFKWKNTIRVSVGGTYLACDGLLLRAGFAYDETPIPNAAFRTAGIPGDNRYWIALGAGYDFSCCLHLDVGYAFLFVDNAPIDHTCRDQEECFVLPKDTFEGGLRGKYSSYTNILSAQLVWDY